MTSPISPARRHNARAWQTLLSVALLLWGSLMPVPAQASRHNEYGANLTIALYQFDGARSKQTRDVTILRQTATSAEEETEFITRIYGIDELKIRHVRSVGLAGGESFSDAYGTNEKLLSFSIVPRAVSRDTVQFDFRAEYAGQRLLDLKDVSVGSYETVMLRGGEGDFGVREFAGPDGTESVPDRRALLVTITPVVIAVRGLQNRPSDLSRPTNRYGATVRLAPDDVFILPSVLSRVELRFSAGSAPKGSITLEAVITPDGQVTNVKVLDSPEPAYNARAIEVFRQFRFVPAKLNGKPTWATWRETFILGRPDGQ